MSKSKPPQWFVPWTEPRTAAGRALHAEQHEIDARDDHATCDLYAILAIEAEARAAALDDVVRELDERIPPMEWPDGFADKVLAAIDALRERA